MQKLRTLLLLLLAYAAATFVPGPGLWLRELNLGSNSVQPPQVLLATLLLSAGLCSSKGALRTTLKTRVRFLAMAISAWIIPLIAAVLTVAILWGGLGCPPRVALGVVIIAAMPVANSSVGWATSLGGSVTLSIALLVVGTALSPLLTPIAINAGAYSLNTAEQALHETPWSEGMGQFFFMWVLVPVLLGVLIAGRLHDSATERLVPVARRLSFFMLILLNYLNGAACLPALAEQPQLLTWPLLGAGCLLLTSLALGQGLASRSTEDQAANSDNATQVSLVLAVVMRNTGAALVFAGAALPDYAAVSLTIIAYTMLQHVGVGFLLGRNSSEPHHR